MSAYDAIVLIEADGLRRNVQKIRYHRNGILRLLHQKRPFPVQYSSYYSTYTPVQVHCGNLFIQLSLRLAASEFQKHGEPLYT